MDKEFFILYFVASDALQSGRLVPCQMKSSMTSIRVIYVHREKDNFKSREVKCLKECALALTISTVVLRLLTLQGKIFTLPWHMPAMKYKKTGKFFPMKDTGHVTETLTLIFFLLFRVFFYPFSINIRIKVALHFTIFTRDPCPFIFKCKQTKVYFNPYLQ